MRFVYYGGGIGDENLTNLRWLASLHRIKPNYDKILDATEAKAFIINNPLNDITLIPAKDRDFHRIAEPALRHMYKNRTVHWKDATRTQWFKSTNDIGVKTFRERIESIEQAQEQHARKLYESILNYIQREFPAGFPVLFVPGESDLKCIVDVLGNERVLHNRTHQVCDMTFLGMGAIDRHDIDVAEKHCLMPSRPRSDPSLEAKILYDNASCDVIITNEFIEGHFTKELPSNAVYEEHGLSLETNGFVKGRWLKDARKQQKRKLVITPANHCAFESEASALGGAVALNAGQNIPKRNAYAAYIVEMPDKTGVDKISAVFPNGAAKTAYRASGYTYTARDVENNCREAMTTRFEPGGEHDTSVKITRELRRAKTAHDLEGLAEVSPGLEKLFKRNASLQRRNAVLREQHSALEREMRRRVTRERYHVVLAANAELLSDYRALNRDFNDVSKAFARVGTEVGEDKSLGNARFPAGIRVYEYGLTHIPAEMRSLRGLMLYNMGSFYNTWGTTVQDAQKFTDAMRCLDEAKTFRPRDKQIPVSIGIVKRNLAP